MFIKVQTDEWRPNMKKSHVHLSVPLLQLCKEAVLCATTGHNKSGDRSKSYINDCSYYVSERPATVCGEHNSQRVHVHVYKGLWGAFTNWVNMWALLSRLSPQHKQSTTCGTALLYVHSPESFGAGIRHRWGNLPVLHPPAWQWELYESSQWGKKWGSQKESLAGNIITNKVLRYFCKGTHSFLILTLRHGTLSQSNIFWTLSGCEKITNADSYCIKCSFAL